uniref:phosphomevalonate kinase n=1 Tax=Oryza punctata TaxID=4537 RepID=A0A0E0KBD7_ORYPU
MEFVSQMGAVANWMAEGPAMLVQSHLHALRSGGHARDPPRFLRRRQRPRKAARFAVLLPAAHHSAFPHLRIASPSRAWKVASAPGKVLVAGGYLVLERPNAGLVLSTSARFYAIVRPLRDELSHDSWAWAWTDVKVTSPQLSREATYKLSLKKSTLQLTESANPFVEQAVQFSVAAAKVTVADKEGKEALDKLLLQGLHITILGCNDFYSYRKQIEALAKTGLGSSAAMTTSVVAALLHYLGAVNLSCLGQSSSGNAAGRDLDLLHAIAQSAHCIAQGKIGSGFDVSAAVYGSQRYTRFSPEILSSAQVTGGHCVPDVVADIVTQSWDHEKAKFSLPPLMSLLLGEPGTGGSSTPSMVGSVKQWQKSDPQKSKETWSKLGIANSVLESQLRNLNKLAEDHWESYESVLRSCSHLMCNKWTEVATNQHQELIVRSLLAARDTFLEIRLHMREMGIAACVPIEPESQTQLLDATMNMEGVLLAGVPGAGGFDAVFSVILGEASDVVAKAWSSAGVLPLLVREDPRGVSLETGDPRTREKCPGSRNVPGASTLPCPGISPIKGNGTLRTCGSIGMKLRQWSSFSLQSSI